MFLAMTSCRLAPPRLIKKCKLEKDVDAFLLLSADYQMEQNVKWGESLFGHKVINRQRQNFHEILVNDYIVENPVFDERKVDLAKVRIAEVVVESKQEDQTRRSNNLWV
jgi:hypothetical protein